MNLLPRRAIACTVTSMSYVGLTRTRWTEFTFGIERDRQAMESLEVVGDVVERQGPCGISPGPHRRNRASASARANRSDAKSVGVMTQAIP
jgi:hypothetical protein